MVLLVGAWLLAACTHARNTAITVQTAAREIQLRDTLAPTDTIALGRIKQGEVIRFDLQLRNATRKQTVILSAQSSCGCTRVEYPHHPIASEASAPLSFEFDSRGFVGWQLKKITLRHSASSTPCTLIVTADVIE